MFGLRFYCLDFDSNNSTSNFRDDIFVLYGQAYRTQVRTRVKDSIKKMRKYEELPFPMQYFYFIRHVTHPS